MPFRKSFVLLIGQTMRIMRICKKDLPRHRKRYFLRTNIVNNTHVKLNGSYSADTLTFCNSFLLSLLTNVIGTNLSVGAPI